MCEFTDCYACDGDGHVEGDITLDCYYCWGTGQTKIQWANEDIRGLWSPRTGDRVKVDVNLLFR